MAREEFEGYTQGISRAFFLPCVRSSIDPSMLTNRNRKKEPLETLISLEIKFKVFSPKAEGRCQGVVYACVSAKRNETFKTRELEAGLTAGKMWCSGSLTLLYRQNMNNANLSSAANAIEYLQLRSVVYVVFLIPQ